MNDPAPLDTLITYLQPDTSAPMTMRMKVMEPFLVRGLATAEQIASLSGVDYKRVGETLNTLTEASFDRPKALRTAQVILEGKRGRPQKLYILTPEGAAVLRPLFSVSRLKAPAVQDPVELNAAFATLEVYTAAMEAGLTATVEKVFPFGEGRTNLRIDVFVQPPNLLGIPFELEQQVNQGTMPRLLDKLRRMEAFFRKSEVSMSREVRVLFNLPQGDRNTLPTWREALRLVSQEKDLPFQLYWMPIVRFLESPQWTSVTGFQLLEPKAFIPPGNAYAEMSQASEVLSLPQMKGLLQVMQARAMQKSQDFEALYGGEHEERVCTFFSLIGTIYKASYHREHLNQVYSTPPVESMELLKEYLHEPQNRNLLSEMRLAMDWLNRRVSMANYLMAAHRVLWDVFMRFHGLGDTGLKFRIELPGYSQGPDDLEVKVSLGPHMSFWVHRKYSHSPEEALAWILEALLKYPYDLGLAEFPWHKPSKGKRSSYQSYFLKGESK
ncbi:MAG TPA: hypothetical protein PK530_00905 [Anaerolineales bacterium]|nr:hypothetical protein [Anaerolineales bacterium]